MSIETKILLIFIVFVPMYVGFVVLTAIVRAKDDIIAAIKKVQEGSGK